MTVIAGLSSTRRFFAAEDAFESVALDLRFFCDASRGEERGESDDNELDDGDGAGEGGDDDGETGGVVVVGAKRASQSAQGCG